MARKAEVSPCNITSPILVYLRKFLCLKPSPVSLGTAQTSELKIVNSRRHSKFRQTKQQLICFLSKNIFYGTDQNSHHVSVLSFYYLLYDVVFQTVRKLSHLVQLPVELTKTATKYTHIGHYKVSDAGP